MKRGQSGAFVLRGSGVTITGFKTTAIGGLNPETGNMDTGGSGCCILPSRGDERNDTRRRGTA
jgi:hypothetical protein